jgi:hypothetical protein
MPHLTLQQLGKLAHCRHSTQLPCLTVIRPSSLYPKHQTPQPCTNWASAAAAAASTSRCSPPCSLPRRAGLSGHWGSLQPMTGRWWQWRHPTPAQEHHAWPCSTQHAPTRATAGHASINRCGLMSSAGQAQQSALDDTALSCQISCIVHITQLQQPAVETLSFIPLHWDSAAITTA